MQYSTNYEMNKPERADQYNIDHWNANTDIIDAQLKANADAVSDETTRATGAENNVDAFNDVLIVSGGISEQKTVTLPVRFRNGVCCKFLFPNGHNCANSSTYLTLNDANNNRIPIVVNKYGDFKKIPIHTITENGVSTYKCLQPNTVLEMYYTTNYDGNNNSAFVVIGNPVVLSSADYTIYADGNIEYKSEYRLEVASGGVDDPTQQTQSTYNYEIDSNYGINVGDRIKVTFIQELQSSVPITTVNLSCGGRNGAIVTRQNNTTITNQPTAEYKWVASHVFNGGNYSSTYKNKVWDANTTLELEWTGSYWLVIDNPITCSYTSTSADYNVYANGLIKQYFKTSFRSNTSVNFLISYSNTNYKLNTITTGIAGVGEDGIDRYQDHIYMSHMAMANFVYNDLHISGY